MISEFVNLITSDSDIESQSQNFVQSIQIQQMPTGQDNYQKFISSNSFTITNPLKILTLQLIKFIQNSQKNIIFIFGPSGCGKKSLLINLLKQSRIEYQIKQEFQNENQSWQKLQDIITNVIQKSDRCDKIYVFNDFPISTQSWNIGQIKRFKKGLPDKIRKCQQKVVFLLNSQIYNSFYILNEANPFESLDKLRNVSVIKMQAYGKRQMKQILKSCCQRQPKSQYTKYLYEKNTFDEIVQLSGGDARKALNLLYWRRVQEKSQAFNKGRMSQKKNTKGIRFYKQKNQNKKKLNGQIEMQFQDIRQKYQIPPIIRISLFHALGKLLYAKRLNVKGSFGKKKQISCYYNQEQIDRIDPPFYFNPIQLFQKTHSPLSVFTSLLQQNYLNRFGKISDVVAINKVFLLYNHLFSNQNIYENQDVTQIKIILVTWGMLICNKNSRTDVKTLQRIQRSKCNSLATKLKQKKNLLKKYYSQCQEKDLITWAHILNKRLQRSNSFQKGLYDIIFTNKKNTMIVQENVQSMKQFQQDDESQYNMIEALQIKQKLNKAVQQMQRKQRNLNQIIMEQEECLSELQQQS